MVETGSLNGLFKELSLVDIRLSDPPKIDDIPQLVLPGKITAIKISRLLII
ncbi:hypothetical protein Hanom_Chr03g00218771 [Helianthus anomalus]